MELLRSFRFSTQQRLINISSFEVNPSHLLLDSFSIIPVLLTLRPGLYVALSSD